jgi:hypothetical protein
MDFLFYAFIYLNLGYALSCFCWNNYEPGANKFSLKYFILWPLSTMENIGRWESQGGVSPIIGDFQDNNSEIAYKTIVSVLWPLKIAANIFLMLIIAAIFTSMIAIRLIATLAVLSVYLAVMPARVFFKTKAVEFTMIGKIWQKRLVIVES